MPLYFSLHDVCKTVKCTPPKADVLRSALINAGESYSKQSHYRHSTELDLSQMFHMFALLFFEDCCAGQAGPTVWEAATHFSRSSSQPQVYSCILVTLCVCMQVCRMLFTSAHRLAAGHLRVLALCPTPCSLPSPNPSPARSPTLPTPLPVPPPFCAIALCLKPRVGADANQLPSKLHTVPTSVCLQHVHTYATQFPHNRSLCCMQ